MKLLSKKNFFYDKKILILGQEVEIVQNFAISYQNVEKKLDIFQIEIVTLRRQSFVTFVIVQFKSFDYWR